MGIGGSEESTSTEVIIVEGGDWTASIIDGGYALVEAGYVGANVAYEFVEPYIGSERTHEELQAAAQEKREEVIIADEVANTEAEEHATAEAAATKASDEHAVAEAAAAKEAAEAAAAEEAARQAQEAARVAKESASTEEAEQLQKVADEAAANAAQEKAEAEAAATQAAQEKAEAEAAAAKAAKEKAEAEAAAAKAAQAKAEAEALAVAAAVVAEKAADAAKLTAEEEIREAKRKEMFGDPDEYRSRSESALPEHLRTSASTATSAEAIIKASGAAGITQFLQEHPEEAARVQHEMKSLNMLAGQPTG